ncbi:outer membrane protein TolC [Halanaerobium saccharolyticum]|uniref:Outer membrane protein TolC n=1 Tax=Halanaerobium saccharolyticum TaxID=43595 RepID=A0A4R6LZU5_9FIRM|nr:TolC family protein [Halanaerobium saccharolyticum]TDO94363.1 outer membrane protein TolC [Halanaerobium saccharolyticum]
MKLNKIILFSIILIVISGFIPVSMVAAEINLDAVLKSALENNNTLKSARERLKAAEMQKKASDSIMNSKLSGELSWQDEELTEDGSIFSTINYSKFLAESSGTEAQLDKADLKYYIAELEYKKTREEVLAAVIKQYYNFLKIENLIKSQKSAVAEAEALYQNAKKRHADNLITDADLLRTKINLEKVREELKSLKSDRIKAKEELILLTGINAAELKLVDRKVTSLESNFEFKKELLLKKAYKNRSDYQIKKLNADLIRADIKYLNSKDDPVFFLGGEYLFEDGRVKSSLNSKYQFNLSASADTREQNEKYISVKNLELLEESEWKVTAALSYQFSDGGKNNAEIKAAEARLKESEFGLKNLEAQIKIEVSNLLRELNLAKNRVDTAAQNLKRAKLEYQSTKSRYQKGAVIESELISAQKLVAEAEANLAAAEYAVQLKRTEILAAVENIHKSFTTGKLGGDSSE